MTDHPTAAFDPRAPRRRRAPMRRILGLATAIGLLTLSLAVPAAAAAAPPTAAVTDGSTSTACAGGRWPISVQGMPTVHAGSAAGDYLWHDATGWHLRVTHAGTLAVGFSGTIRANKPIHVRAFRLEAGDRFTVSADRLSVTYRFVNHGRLDGLDLTTECATRLGVSTRLNGSLLPVRRIWLGHYGRHPLQNPFVVLRPA